MSSFDDFEAELGIDPTDPREALAKELVDGDLQLLEELVRIREARDMSKSDVADAIGRHRSVITNFEKLSSDPHLSTIRRYALAVGARIIHMVVPVDAPEMAPMNKPVEGAFPDATLPSNVIYADFRAETQPSLSRASTAAVTTTFSPIGAPYSATATAGALAAIVGSESEE